MDCFSLLSNADTDAEFALVRECENSQAAVRLTIEVSAIRFRQGMNINVDLSALSVEQLKRAVQLKEQITRLEEELATLTGSQRSAAKLVSRPRPMISEAGRARIVAAQRRRWARERALKAAPQPATSTPPPAAAAKRVLTAEARAKMSAASKERWARVRAGHEGKEQA